MGGPSVIDQAREYTGSQAERDLLARLAKGQPTMTDDLPDFCPDNDQYRYNHNNLDHIPASSCAATGFSSDTYAGAPWGAGPSPGKKGKEGADGLK
ncbi:hypothetical protein JCM8097_007305 [Rhodosporidiobolus ruineniae]